jgi:hypothetical protein
MGKKLAEYIQFMCQAANLKGVSGEATENAIRAFYEQMVVLERQLGRIHNDFRLQ